MFSFNFFVRIRIPGKSLALVMLRNTRRRRLSGAATWSVERGDVRRRKRGAVRRRATTRLKWRRAHVSTPSATAYK